jgi:voltage-gated potassium channel Kch
MRASTLEQRMEKQHSTLSRERSIPSEAERRIVFVGFGAEAERIGRALGNRASDVVVVESDAVRAARARVAGYRVVEGEVSDTEVLRRARVGQAEVVALTAPIVDERSVEAIRKVRTVGTILTNLPKGYADMDQPDASLIMTQRILGIIGRPTH